MSRYNCNECDSSFPTTMELARHVRWEHRTKMAKFTCEQCEKSFDTVHGLNLHITRMHRNLGGKEKKISKTVAPAVSFCPCCGTNIRLFSQALAAIGGLQDG